MSEKNKSYKILNTNKKGSELEIEIQVPIETLENQRQNAIKDISNEIEIQGFRKGTAPENLIIEKVGEMAVLEKISFRVINNVLPIIITEEKIDALSQPSISITKIAVGSPLEFKAKFTLMPEVELADYKKIAKEIEEEKDIKVEDKEVDEYIEQIRKSKATKDEKSSEEILPEFNDEFVKTLGDFSSVEDFKKKLKENMIADKKQRALEKRRLQIMEKIIDESKITVPEILIDQELNRMVGEFKHRVEGMKINFEEYLKQINKTEDDMRKEWETDAIKRSKMNLILPNIAIKEKIKADEKEIEKEVNHLLEHHPDLNKEHAKVYVTNVLTNESVFRFLEKI